MTLLLPLLLALSAPWLYVRCTAPPCRPLQVWADDGPEAPSGVYVRGAVDAPSEIIVIGGSAPPDAPQLIAK